MMKRVALVFGLMNLFFGVTGFIRPLVKPSYRGMNILNMFKRNNPSWLNTQPGTQFGIFGTNWVHSLVHLMLAVPAFIPAVRNRFSRVYLGVLAANYALLSVMDYMHFGNKSGVHMVLGQGQNRWEEYLNAGLAAMGLSFLMAPAMRQLPSVVPQVRQQAEHVVNQVTSKVQKEPTEKMPV